VVSRADDKFLYKLFELEIPEIYDGILEIKGISRDPGERAKIAVLSNDDKIDAVGACVGMKGMRIHSIVRELCNENIDVINYTKDNALYISRALSPAKLQDIYIDNENKVAKINADEDQVSLIIGKNGQNIKLASKLTGFQIDVIREQNDEDEEEEDDENTNEEMNNEDTENVTEENTEEETSEDTSEEQPAEETAEEQTETTEEEPSEKTEEAEKPSKKDKKKTNVD
jgi:N utilization substance protein A